ncbi:hypothetical protein C8J57DRAFT_1370327 [Mycena rebaudengoi]|nr:hypothetical protein C8J57DRAFT_1370327 [Mycena rebaudengoi]
MLRAPLILSPRHLAPHLCALRLPLVFLRLLLRSLAGTLASPAWCPSCKPCPPTSPPAFWNSLISSLISHSPLRRRAIPSSRQVMGLKGNSRLFVGCGLW